MSLTINLGNSLKQSHGLLRLPRLTHEEFWDLCKKNPALKLERKANGDLIIMAPTGGETGSRNSKLIRFLDEWSDRDGNGIAFDSSTLFRLENGAERSPDASWIRFDRWNRLSAVEREEPAPVCPDFVVELMSPSDRLRTVENKMREYIANGALLGFLIDRKRRRVHVYRPNEPVLILDNPTEIKGDPELPGLIIPMDRIL